MIPDRRLVPARPIRSFVRREGRMTPAQRRAFSELFTRYGVELDGRLDLDRVFGRVAPRTLEIGFGDGETLATLATTAPHTDFLGIEVHRPGVGHLLLELERRQLSNVRVICADAVETLAHHLAPACFDHILLLFPDPWPKHRHHKRRILQPAFTELVADHLRPGGTFHLATDWEDYARQMLADLDASGHFCNAAGKGRFSPKPAYRPVTKFERRGQRLGHGVRDLVYTRGVNPEDGVQNSN